MYLIKSAWVLKIIMLASISSLTLISACKSPLQLYKIDIRQGNYMTQSMVDQLQPNQSKAAVKAILGSPAHIPVLNKDTWVYDYSLIPGSGNRPEEHKRLSLKFVNNKLQSYSGDWEIKQLKKSL
jgi:outer membrane protein assembly factor BamE